MVAQNDSKIVVSGHVTVDHVIAKTIPMVVNKLKVATLKMAKNHVDHAVSIVTKRTVAQIKYVFVFLMIMHRELIFEINCVNFVCLPIGRWPRSTKHCH